jgi:hypothetical protein
MAKYKDLAIQLTIVTAGVFIALFVDSLVEWNQYRRLVKEARATLTREITYNQKEIQLSVASVDAAMRDFENAINLADDMIKSGKSEITQVHLGLVLADLTDAGWQTAERTGALAHMDYADVQQLSMLYDLQQFVADQQRTALEHLTQASGFLTVGDPTKDIGAKDFETFRAQVMTLRADVVMLEKFAKRLSEQYAKVLAEQAR